MKLQINDKNGIILKTAGKFCGENIEVSLPENLNGASVIGGSVPAVGNYDGFSDIKEVEVHKLYFNTELSIEEVKKILSAVEFSVTPLLPFPSIIAVVGIEAESMLSKIFVFVKSNDEYALIELDSNVPLFCSSQIIEGADFGFEGWNPLLIENGSCYDINGVLIKPGFDEGEILVDNQQEKYAGIISLTPDFEEVTKELSGEYDGAPVAVTQNGKVDISSMLEMKRLPLALEVAVPVPDGYVKPEKEVYTSVNGTLDVTDAALCTVDVKMINTQPCTFLQLQIPTDNFTLKFKESGFKSWGDGAVDDLITHTYEKAGRYTLVANLAEISHSNTFYQDFENQNVCVTEITVGSAVSEVGIGAFQKCPGLTKVYLHDGITRIGRWAFQLTSLEEVFIPSGVTVIEEYVFADCLNLKRVHIPASVTEIISYAFVRSESIEGFYYGGTVEQWNAITKGQWDSQIGSYTVYCTDGEIVKQ